jgi:hypothetical protein
MSIGGPQAHVTRDESRDQQAAEKSEIMLAANPSLESEAASKLDGQQAGLSESGSKLPHSKALRAFSLSVESRRLIDLRCGTLRADILMRSSLISKAAAGLGIRPRLLLLTLWFSSLPATGWQVATREGECAIDGKVTDAVDGRPVAEAQVGVSYIFTRCPSLTLPSTSRMTGRSAP